MTKSNRKAIVTDEHRAEARKLKAIWDATKNRPKQEDFGRLYGIGSQSAVSQFLNAEVALSRDAASGFAIGLGCEVGDFSSRLEAEIAKLADAIRKEDQDTDHASVMMVDAKASAGKGTLVFSADVKKSLMFRRDYLARHGASPEETLAFQVDGESMVDMHIPHGSIVLANRKKKEPISKRIYVLWLHGELCVKQVVKSGGRLWARSHNAEKADNYPDVPIENEDRIEGQAFWCGYDLR